MSSCSCHFHDYYSENIYTWCTNCGNFGIHAAIKRALVAECVEPKDALLCFDIGCNGNGSDKISGYRYHGLHGRVIPFACGASAANRRVKVLAFGGDGGTLGEGVNHLVHAIRGNYNVTFVLHNNLNYGLTQGQASPASQQGTKMNSTPDGVTAEPLHVARFVLSLNPTFVARTFSGDVKHMTEVVRRGMQHQGFSFIEILQSCPTYNKQTPHEWYQERVKDVATLPDYRPQDIGWARQVSEDLEQNIAIGVLYQQSRPDFLAQQVSRQGLKTELVDEVQTRSVENLLKEFQ
jgi:2-oxoglutarate/2-oxoacid ferredoxin oxidoreductase subunit beta